MKKVFNFKASLIVVGLLALPLAQAATMTKDAYKSGKDSISAQYKTDKAACAPMSANAKDVCVEEAKANEKVARAELEYGYTGKARDGTKVLEVKAKTAYAVAKEKCDDRVETPKTSAARKPKRLKSRHLQTPKWANKSPRRKQTQPLTSAMPITKWPQKNATPSRVTPKPVA